MKKVFKEPFVSIIIRTRNRLEDLKKCLGSIFLLDYSNYEVIVVNDDSTDGTKDFLQKKYSGFKNVRILNIKKSKSTANLYNIGFENSKGEIITYTDDDCVVDSGWINELVKTFLENKSVMVVGGKSYIADTDKIYCQGEVSGCNMAFKREIFKYFRFDKGLIYSHYYDEWDLINRIKDKGFLTEINNNAVVNHFVRPGAHRQKTALGISLNGIYSHVKRKSLLSYYFLLFFYFKNRKNFTAERNSIEEGIKNAIGTVFFGKRLSQILYVFWLIFIWIPIKSRIKHFQEEKFFKNNFLNSPKNIIFFITSKCNSNCKHCFLRDLNQNQEDISQENIFKIIDSLNKPANIILTGGETLLRNGFLSLLQGMLLNKNVASVAVTSNGFLPEKISELEPIILKSKKGLQLTISLDGLEKTHNEIRGVANAFKNVVKSCEIAKNLSLKYPKFKFAVNIVLMKENVGEIEKLVDFLELKGYSSLFTPVRGNSFSSFNLDKEIEIKDYGPKVANQLNLDEIENAISLISQKYPRYFWGMNKKLLDLIIKTLRAKKRQIKCYAGYESAVIYSSGLIAVCEQLKPFGNLKDWDFNILNAWNSKEADQHRQKTLNCACTHTCNLYNSLEIEQNKHFFAVLKNKAILAYKSLKFTEKIEAKRGSEEKFWKIVISAKDFIFEKFFN